MPPSAMTRRTIPVVHTRVFPEADGGGAPCPVVLRGEQLSSAERMEAARRWKLETAFILPASAAGCAFRLRVYAPQREMDMCLHATIAAAAVAVRTGSIGPAPLRIQFGKRILDAHVADGSPSIITVEDGPPSFMPNFADETEVADALGLSAGELALDAGPLQVVSTSRPKLIVPVRDIPALRRITPAFERLWTICERSRATGLYTFAPATGGNRVHFEARQFPLRTGYLEDAATGVAAAALAAYAARYCAAVLDVAEGAWLARVRQGVSLGRPSLMTVHVPATDDLSAPPRVSGPAVCDRIAALLPASLTVR